jgi:hypothetical protein
VVDGRERAPIALAPIQREHEPVGGGAELHHELRLLKLQHSSSSHRSQFPWAWVLIS